MVLKFFTVLACFLVFLLNSTNIYAASYCLSKTTQQLDIDSYYTTERKNSAFTTDRAGWIGLIDLSLTERMIFSRVQTKKKSSSCPNSMYTLVAFLIIYLEIAYRQAVNLVRQREWFLQTVIKPIF